MNNEAGIQAALDELEELRAKHAEALAELEKLRERGRVLVEANTRHFNSARSLSEKHAEAVALLRRFQQDDDVWQAIGTLKVERPDGTRQWATTAVLDLLDAKEGA